MGWPLDQVGRAQKFLAKHGDKWDLRSLDGGQVFIAESGDQDHAHVIGASSLKTVLDRLDQVVNEDAGVNGA